MKSYTFDSAAQMKELLGPMKILDNMMCYYEIYQAELEKSKKHFLLRGRTQAKKTEYLYHLLEKDILRQINQISKIIYILPMNCRYYIAVDWIYKYIGSKQTDSILTAAKRYQEELQNWSQEKKKLYEQASLQSNRFKLAFETFYVPHRLLPPK